MADDKVIDLDAARAEREQEAWMAHLQKQGNRFAGNEFNVSVALTEAPEFLDAIAFNRRIFMPVTLRKTPAGSAGEWGDAHTVRCAIWLQQRGIQAKPQTVDRALLAVCRRVEFDPLEDWLFKIEWDRQPRIGTWLADYAQAEASAANSIMGSKFLIGAIARALNPGCRMDYMLVLEGVQGAKKSTLIKVLGGEYAGENLPDFHSRDAMQIASSKWIIEIGELAAVRKSDLESIKAFITRVEDSYVPKYLRYPITVKRRCVLIGNLNPDGNGYLQDSTGNRRFWPVKVGQIDIEALKRDRIQLWAEAVYCYLRGDHWWLENSETSEIAEQQTERLMEVPWEAIVAKWAENQVGTFTTMDLALSCLEMRKQDINRSLSTRVGIILKNLGFAKRRTREDGQLTWRYAKPEPL